MSYDLVIVPKRDGQSWAEALEAEPAAAGDGLDPALWDVLVGQVEQIVGDVSTDDAEAERGLTHERSGIQVRCRADRASVSVPFWYTGADAEAVVAVLYRVGHVVATVTGLTAFDPQLELPLSEAQARPGDAVAVFEHAAQALSEFDAGDYFEVYFTGAFTLADAAQQLKGLVIAEDEHRLTVRWADDGPLMWVAHATGPQVAADSDELAQLHGEPELAGHGSRYEVTFEDLDEVLQEINTLIEVQLNLQELTGGYVARSWNGEITRAGD